MSSQRDKKKRRLSSAQRSANHGMSRDFASLTLPKDLKLVRIKEDCKKRWSIIPFIASEKNPMAVKYDRVGKLYFERTFWAHAQIGPNNESFTCPAKSTAHLPLKQRLRCPICEERAKLARNQDVAEEDLLAVAKERQLWLIYDHDEPDAGLQLFEASFHGLGKDIDEAVRSDMAEEDPQGLEYYADPEDGMMLLISFKAKATGGRGKWFPPARIDFKPRKTSLPDEIVNHNYSLDDMIRILPYKELQSMLLQGAPEDDDDDADDDDADRPVKKPKKRSMIEEAFDDEDDEEDEPPRKKKRPVVEEDEDDEPPRRKKRPPVDDDDDDDLPRKKKKKRPVDDDEDDD